MSADFSFSDADVPVRGYPNVLCNRYLSMHGWSDNYTPSRRVGYVNHTRRNWDIWSYAFYDRQTGKKLGEIDVDVPCKGEYRQNPPPPLESFEKLLRQLNSAADAVNAASAKLLPNTRRRK